uniref:Gag-like protein n=1 Tax=Blattella germanica TaxID=6973 RepID=A0A0K1IJN6_BLAGE|nr:gag-like protein [Blattella germanica]
MAEEAGGEIVAVVIDHLNKVKEALQSRHNMEKTIKEEALHSVSEINNLLNKLSGMFLGLECTLKKAITSGATGTPRLYSEQLVASVDAGGTRKTHTYPPLTPSGDQPETAGIIITPTDPNMKQDSIKQIIRETIDPKSLKVGVSKMKKLSNNSLFVECNSNTDREILEKELSKLETLSTERPKKKLPAMLLKFVPQHIENSEIQDIILQQNDLMHLANPEIIVKFTKKSFDDSRHVVIQVSPHLRKELLAKQRIKMKWSMCRIEDFVIVTRCYKCLGYGHTKNFCTNKQTCSNCAEEHDWRECRNTQHKRCVNCVRANTLITNNNKKLDTNHSAISQSCPRLKRIDSIIINKTEY